MAEGVWVRLQRGVVEVGAAPSGGGEAAAFGAGDEVFGMILGLPQFGRGTVAEYVVVEAAVCARKPPGLPHPHAASAPLVAITAVKMLRACGLGPKEGCAPPDNSVKRVLVTGGAGGVGTIAIQLAKAMFKCGHVTATASPGAKTDLCKNLGADEVVNYREHKLETLCSPPLSLKPFDTILDCTGEAARLVPLLTDAGHGSMCSILAGPTAECLRTWVTEANLDPQTITTGVRPFIFSGVGGSILQHFSGGSRLEAACRRKHSTFAHVIGTGNGEIMATVAELMASGQVRAVIDKEYPLSEAVEAINYQASGRAAGKVVVNIISTTEDATGTKTSPGD